MSNHVLLVPPRPAIDENWYRRLRLAAPTANALYTVLQPTQEQLEQQRQRFFTGGCRDNPDLKPDGAARDTLLAEAACLRQIEEAIAVEESEPLVRSAYQDRITELLANVGMYDAAYVGDTAEFLRANTAVYGLPEREVHNAVVGWLRSLADKASGEPVSIVHDLLPVYEPTPLQLEPDQQTYAAVKTLHSGPDGFFANLFGGAVPDVATAIDRQAGDVYINRMLDALQAEQYEVTDTTTGYWGVLHDTRRIVRPAEYALSGDAFLAIASHEIGSHLLERLNGDRQPLRLLAYGLVGYERGNEGRALVREQVAYRDWAAFAQTQRWAEIMCRHLAICVASGYQGKPYDFARTFRLIKAVLELWQQLWPEAIVAPPRDRAWQIVARVFKGTSGQGSPFHKDMVYLEGNLACWRLAARTPQAILAGDAGKFDITNPAHQKLMATLIAPYGS